MSAVATSPLGTPQGTPFARLVEQLRAAADYNPDDVAPPAAVLWPDKAGEWAPLLGALRATLPQLFTLGAYAPDARTGPAIWLKCAVARTLDGASAPAGTVPILYLPGVSLRDLRAVEECPRALQPLAELQYRGRVWAQVNGRDWTALAFLTAGDALGLDVARDAATADALRRALPRLAHLPFGELAGRRLDADELDRIVTGKDPVRDVLRWLDAPAAFEAAQEADTWAAFRNVCRKEFGFDPAQDGRLAGAERLGGRGGAWAKVWERFAEAPAHWAGVPEALRQARPKSNGDLFGDAARGSWPQDNEQSEAELRAALLKLADATPADAAARVSALERAHGERRGWVWSALGRAPLAAALGHLHALAVAVAAPVAGTTPAAMADAYRAGAWRADAAVLEALDVAREHDDAQAIRAAVRALYLPWLAQAAERLQLLAEASPIPTRGGAAPAAEVIDGTVLLFVDGLRYDVAERLRERLAARGWGVRAGWRWSALPSVTPTAKPAVSPAADLLTGDYMGQEFSPNVGASGKALTTHSFRALLDTVGVPYLPADATGDPTGRGWTEVGDLDGHGHAEQAKLARRVPEVLAELEGRIAALFAAGWRRVRVVTDHGWLLVPGGLPKTELPGYVTDARWARCAMLKEGATPGVPLVPWYWNPMTQVAVAPGVSAFVASTEYAHGGVSLQECVIPELDVTPGVAAVPRVAITGVKWIGLRCHATLDGEAAGCLVDLRTFPADPKSTLVGGPKLAAAAGATRLLVDDDAYEGGSAQVVVLDSTGAVLAKHPTTVGDS